MKLHGRFQRYNKTKYIQVNTRSCEACWKCLDACPKQVLGKIEVGFHRHVRILSAEDCTGCKKCVPVCPQSAIEYIYQPASKVKEQISAPM
jgi:Fe-S-cluster-containing hydrogenase component 2